MSGSMRLSPHSSDGPDVTLKQAGFSQEEIERLRSLREMYPYIEYIDSQRQWNRLRFVKWLYLHGQIKQ